ncbi:Crp/Fnr family transcriptional regulator [Thermopetrobacter sp. TC1]|uniref:Crp/Fnr family transcriptional regulator n=1 Tax=Thermopetrobacter sp. TC1 TaxID=1495045 RepID=UPI0005700B60|nr:Crp/Fnr family transcriptional regulator [Thermopetrobacter sp. TC1]
MDRPAATIADKCRFCALRMDSQLICAQMSVGELVELSARSNPTSINRKQPVSARLLQRNPIIAVIDGVIGLQHVLKDGRRSIATLFWQGDIIDLRRPTQRPAGQLVALTPARICALDSETFDRLMRDNPDVQAVTIDNMREQIHLAAEHSVDLGKKSAPERLAAYIFECRRRQLGGDSLKTVDLALRRADIADYMGLQPETVSRGLKELERRGLIALKGRSKVTILNEPALRELANGAPAHMAARA